MSLHDEIMKEVMYRKNTDLDKCPYYIYSLSYHIFNLVNVEKKLLVSESGDHNYRLSIMNVGTSGSGKSHWMKLFCDSPNGLINEKCSIAGKITGETTSAGAFGSETVDKNKDIKESPGLFKTMKNDIIAYEEFADLRKAFESKVHNVGFLDNFLRAIETGQVKKDLARVKIDYTTHATVWMGTQPTRIDISSGFFRRILFINTVPDPEQLQETRRNSMQRRQENPKVDDEQIKRLRESIEDTKYKLMNTLRKIDFSNEFLDLMEECNIKNTEMDLYQMLAVGYHIAHDLYDETLIVGAPEGLRKCFLQEIKWRKEIKLGPVKNIILKVVKSNGGKISNRKLYNTLKDVYEMEHNIIESSLREMFNHELGSNKAGDSGKIKRYWFIYQEEEDDE